MTSALYQSTLEETESEAPSRRGSDGIFPLRRTYCSDYNEESDGSLMASFYREKEEPTYRRKGPPRHTYSQIARHHARSDDKNLAYEIMLRNEQSSFDLNDDQEYEIEQDQKERKESLIDTIKRMTRINRRGSDASVTSDGNGNKSPKDFDDSQQINNRRAMMIYDGQHRVAPRDTYKSYKYHDHSSDEGSHRSLTKNEMKWIREFMQNPACQLERAAKRDEARVKLTRVGTSKYDLIRTKVVTSRLSEDTFSFVISAKVHTIPFITAVLIVSLKATLFGLIGFDMFKNGVAGNELLIPPSVTMSVTISQFFAIFIAVATQDDLITSLNLLFEGYSSDLELAFNGALLWKWVTAVASYFLEGSLGLFVTFLLIVTSHEVVELLLNFTAVEFVSLLDNVAFLLAKKGFLGIANRDEALLITKKTYRVTSERKSNPFQRILSLAGTAFLLLSGWGIIFAQQVRGVYLPNQLSVQFEDTLSRKLGTYSGSYFRQNEPWKLDQERISYVSRRGGGKFQYCKLKRFWTFTVNKSGDPCHGYLAKSSQTVDFDLTETLSEPWFATKNPDDPRFYPMTYFHISIGCLLNEDCGGMGHGVCVHNECVCNQGYFGIRCDYNEETTCEKLDVDSSTDRFRGSREFSIHYKILRDREDKMVQVYDHPVFVGMDHSQHLDLMVFTGIRWGLFDSGQGFKNLESPTLLEIADYFMERGKDFHAIELRNIEFITEPVRFNTPVDRVVPSNERWYSTRGEEIEDIEVVLPLDIVMLCEICDEIRNPCFNGNRCLPNGQCLCTNGAKGELCQIRPLGDGRCHQFFNTPTYDFDSGDCCKSTCVSTEINTCGVRNEDGKLESVNVGFSDCVDPSSRCTESGCWWVNSNPIPLLSQRSDKGLKSLVKLSANGRILVLSEPSLDAVRVFDLVDSRWTQRGQLLEGDRDSGFGRMSVISSTPGSVFSRRFGKVPLELAVVHHYQGMPWVRTFRWLPNDMDWRVFSDINLCSYLNQNEREMCDVCTLDVGSDHDSVTVAVGLDNGKALIFRTDVTEIAIKPWVLVAVLDGHHVSLSGDSHRLATAMQYGNIIDLFRIVNSPAGVESTILIPIDHHVISTHYDYDLHNGAIIDYKGNASHIEKIQLSSDGTALALAAYGDEGDDFLLHYAVSIDRVSYDASKRIQLPQHSQSEKASGLTTIYFSDAASVVAVRHHLDATHDEVQVFEHKMQIGGLYTWAPLGQIFDSVTPDEDFSISHDGVSVVFGGQTNALVYELSDRCSHDEAHFRLSISLDSYPANVTWSLQTVRQLGHLQIPRFTLRDCDYCYNNNDRFGRKSIVEEICVPKAEQNCLSLVFQAEHGFADGAGFAAFLDGTDLIKSEDGGTEPVVWSSSETLARECQVEVLECAENESLFVLALKLDRHEEETSWDIIDSNYKVLADHENYSPDLSSTTVVHEVCIPKDECVAFTLHDKYGDGSCCDYGKGGYSIWLDGELYETGDGRFGSKLRSLIGEQCPIHSTCSGLSYVGDAQVIENDDDSLYYDDVCNVNPIMCPSGRSLLVVELTHDIFPEEVAWHVYDQQYNLLAEKTRYHFDDISKTSIHQLCVPSDQCLAFVFEDSIGDGEHEGRGYILYLDGVEVVNRHESSVGRERDSFGLNCLPTSAVTIEINFDDFPQETGWSLIDSSNIPVIEVFPHTYTQENDNMVYTFELPVGEVFTLIMLDDDGNGMCCAFGEGSYAVYMGNIIDHTKVLVAGNGEFASDRMHYFVNSEEGLTAINAPWQ